MKLSPFLPCLLAVPLLLDCGGKVPASHAWSLEPGVAAASARAESSGPRLGIARFSSALVARTTGLTWKEAEGLEVHARPYDAWVDYPDRMLERIARSHLEAAGSFATVTRTPPDKGLDGVLNCRLLEFTELVAGETSSARVVLDWKLVDAGGSVKGGGQLEESEPAGAKTAEEHVRAMQRACDRLCARLASEAAKALAAP